MSAPQASVCVLPTLQAEEDLLDTFYKLVWYIAPYRDQLLSLGFPLHPRLLMHYPTPASLLARPLPSHVDPACQRLAHEMIDQLQFVPSECPAYWDMLGNAQMFFLWDEQGYQNSLDALTCAATFCKTLIRADRHRNPYDGFTEVAGMTSISRHNVSDAQAGIQRFSELARQVKDEGIDKCYVIGTGPNLQLMRDHDFSDGFSIITTSLLGNRDFIARIQPRLVCIVDCVYQLGFTTYAQRVREELIPALYQYPRLQVFTRLQFAPLMRQSLPADLHDRIIACPMLGNVSFNTNLLHGFYTKDIPNVLTVAMLPVAATLARTIELMGCDGSPAPTRDVWDYAPGANYTGEMQILDIAHPAIRKRDNRAYLDQHNAQVADVLAIIESVGASVRSLTPSHIPALARRQQAG